jgi:hypothetical protein
MISLIIPATSRNQDYTDNIANNIKSLYPNRQDVEIVVEINDSATLGINYNNAVARAKGDKIILLHNDMVLSKGFIETMDKHIVPGRVTSYTRVEPPIYPDTYPGKVLLECGRGLADFNVEKYNSFSIEESLVDGGSQLFFGCMKKDYLGIDGYTFEKFCEDDDLHMRYKLAGYEHKISSAHVYHFVSKTSRADSDYSQIEYTSNKNFIRKWGSRSGGVKYDIAYVVQNCNLNILAALEPWCTTVYMEEEKIRSEYITMEQANTKYNLKDRVRTYSFKDEDKPNNIIVEFDGSKLTNENFQLLQQLPQIIKETNELGQFEIDIFKITIKDLTEYQNNLIHIYK